MSERAIFGQREGASGDLVSAPARDGALWCGQCNVWYPAGTVHLHFSGTDWLLCGRCNCWYRTGKAHVCRYAYATGGNEQEPLDTWTPAGAADRMLWQAARVCLARALRQRDQARALASWWRWNPHAEADAWLPAVGALDAADDDGWRP